MEAYTPTSADLALYAIDYYRIRQPREYKKMRRDGTLNEVIEGKVKACKDYAQNLIASGTWEGEAWQTAIREVLLQVSSS